MIIECNNRGMVRCVYEVDGNEMVIVFPVILFMEGAIDMKFTTHVDCHFFIQL